MTSSRLRDVRAALGMGTHAFAEVIGVHVSTLYRWESLLSFDPDPMQARLLDALAKESAKMSAAGCSAFGDKLTRTLVSRGALVALGELIRRVT